MEHTDGQAAAERGGALGLGNAAATVVRSTAAGERDDWTGEESGVAVDRTLREDDDLQVVVDALVLLGDVELVTVRRRSPVQPPPAQLTGPAVDTLAWGSSPSPSRVSCWSARSPT